MTWFRAFRNEYGFMLYKDNTSAVSFDMPLMVVTYFCALVSIATLVATLGIRGHQKWSALLRAVYSLGIGSIILACIYGHSWQVGEVDIKMPYVYRNNIPFDGQVGINVALDGANVTLSGYYGAAKNSLVYYAESMPWADYGEEFRRFNYFLSRGLPAPILKVMEYLTVDSGGLRWGRSFHTAGQFSLALLWTAFAFWMVANILLFNVIVYGAYMCFLTGLSMILACVAYNSCQNVIPLAISFDNTQLTLTYGWCFWLTLAAGIATLLVGSILFLLDYFTPENISDFFHLEKIVDEEHFEFEDRRGTNPSLNPNLLMDRRGSVVPPQPTDRRGSIFLDPCRQTNHFEARMKSHSLGEITGQGRSKDDLFVSKKNPLFINSDIKMLKKKLQQSDGDNVSLNMECLCEDSEVCLSTKKPSLATLKEHRENHANEMLSLSGNSQRSNISSTDQASVHDVSKTPRVSFSHLEILPNFSRRASEGDILKCSHIWDLQESTTISGLEAAEDLEKKLYKDDDETSQKSSSLSRQSSTASSSSDNLSPSQSALSTDCILNDIKINEIKGKNITTVDVTIDIEQHR
ncbi:dual oxidase maturation factor 1-like isoform X3 [Biomphalaria pfeifferi]|uniref:Dual oxidase maturation factor 1-like isoform X3 n=1 Tax=Biomphalaria pfeifferi TaxID=112525 RepID=A0AAD8EXR7_BIOPF|nr:dual oxidase maturation factor 1-like isoform X3 [Biomphalaria pfeifferi]